MPHIRFLRFANLGRDPIRREDIAGANPLRIEVTDTRALDVTLMGAHRDVCKIELQPLTKREGTSAADISFDFLDHQDGGLIRVVTANRAGSISLKGDIIGMPEGIRRAGDLRPHSLLNGVGCVVGILVQIGAIVITPFIYHWVTGKWEHAWIMLLPLLALIVPGAVVGIIASTIWPDSEVPFPKNLAPPEWFLERMSFLREARVRSGAASRAFSDPSYRPPFDPGD